MTKLNEIYKCNICGNIVEVVNTGIGKLVCCGELMNLQEENTVDAVIEKHVPVIEKTEKGYLVKVGDIAHPMEADHYIEWIEVETEIGFCKKFLKPGDKAEFVVCGKAKNARAYCNLHGLWKS